jgi:hypothetical protein
MLLRQQARAVAIQELICDMLRGPHVLRISGADLPTYIYKAGVALHNLPITAASGEILNEYQLQQINDLDPSAEAGKWGAWARRLAEAFGQSLPPAPGFMAGRGTVPCGPLERWD